MALPGNLVDPGAANPWLSSGTGIDKVMCGNNFATKVGSGDYRLLYEAVDTGNGTVSCLATAGSPLGPWAKYGGFNTPIAVLPRGGAGEWDDFQAAVSASCIAWDPINSQWAFLYHGRKSTPVQYSLGMATAPAGSNWQS